MKRLPQIAWLADGKRLHLQDGPIDLIVEATGKQTDVRAAYEAAARRFTGLLDELCEELTELREAALLERCSLKGVVARRMHDAVAPFAAGHFITPMAAVAGAVAEEILGAMLRAAPLERAYVNNGGDIALHLADGQQFSIGLMDRPDRDGVMRTLVVDAGDRHAGHRHQRSAWAQFFARHRRCGDGAGADGGRGRRGRHHHRQRGRSAGASRHCPLPGQRVAAR